MSTLEELTRNVLYEKLEKELKIYYNIDIFLQEFKDKGEEAPEGVEKPEVAPQAPEQQQMAPADDMGGMEAIPDMPEMVGAGEPMESANRFKGDYLTEEIFEQDEDGEISVPESRAKNIMTLDDLLSYIKQKEDDDDKKFLNDLAVEVILSLTTPGQEQAAKEILSEGDKFILELSYGFDNDDCIGIKVVKNKGVKDVSTMLLKNRKPEGVFDKSIFNRTITEIYLKELN